MNNIQAKNKYGYENMLEDEENTVDTASSINFSFVQNFAYRTLTSNYFGPKNKANTKQTAFEKNSFVQNIIDNGVLPDSSNIYLPSKSSKNLADWKKIIVTSNNFNEVMNILNEYKAKHPQFGMGFDYEIWQTYNIPKYVIDYFVNKYNIDVKKPDYDKQTMQFNKRIYDEDYLDYKNRLLREILKHEKDIDKFIIKDPNYELQPKDLINFKSNPVLLNIVGYYYDLESPARITEIITKLFQEKINILKPDWFNTWLNKDNIRNNLNQKVKNLVTGTNLKRFLTNQANLKTDYLVNSSINQDPITINYFKEQLESSNPDVAFFSELANYLNQPILKDLLGSVEWSIEKRRLNNFIKKWNALSLKQDQFVEFEKYTVYETSKDATESSYSLLDTLFDRMISENNQFVNYIKPGSNNYTYPFFMCSFGIDGYMFTFIENAILNNCDVLEDNLLANSNLLTNNSIATGFNTNNLTSLKDYAGLCNGGSIINYFIWLCIANGVFFYGVNSGDFDSGLIKSWMLYEDPWRFSYLNINSNNPTFANGGRVDISWSYLGKDINNYYRNSGDLALHFPFVHLYSDRPWENPLVNGGEIRHTDCIKESSGGAVDEDFGKGLKEVEANHKSSVESNKGLDFRAKTFKEITLKNFTDSLVYNWYDVFNTTVTYANIYKSKQQLAKNAAINLGGQGSDLFDTKDRTVAMLLTVDKELDKSILEKAINESGMKNLSLLNDDIFDYSKKETNQLYEVFLKPYEDALINGTLTLQDLAPIGITYYLKNLLPDLDEKTRERNRSLNFKNALIGAIYRTSYWAKNQKSEKDALDIYPEFTNLNPAHRYIDSFSFDLNNRFEKSSWDDLSKETAMKNLTSSDPVIILMRNKKPSRIVLNNLKLIKLVTGISNKLQEKDGGSGSSNTGIGANTSVQAPLNKTNRSLANLIAKVYFAFQQSDIAVLEEQTKLRQTAVFESTSNGQLVQVAAINGIYLSQFNPLWKPEFKLNYVDVESLSETKRKQYYEANDINNPLYKRVKYLFNADTKDQAHLKDISNLKEEDKPDRDPNQDDFLAFYFDTIIKFDNNDTDDMQYKNVIDFFNSHVIYHSKPWELMDRERMANATYFNRTGKNYPTWSRVWYNEALNKGIELEQNGKKILVSFEDFSNPNNWKVFTRIEFANDELNSQYYPYLVFSFKGFDFELNGLSLKWKINEVETDEASSNFLIAPSKILSIVPFEVHYFKHSKDTKNNEGAVRYELGLTITDEFGYSYNIRLDAISPDLLNRQAERFYGKKDAYHSTLLYAIDKETNLDYDNSKHKWNYKKGSNPVLMKKLKNWFANHPEFPLQSTSNVSANNSFYLHFTNTNNKNILPKLTPKQRKLLNASNLVYVRAGGLHSCTITSFNEDDEIYAIDPDQTSFYPWILMSFVQTIDTFNAPWYTMSYDLNVLLKKLGEKNKREGSKKNVNSISGKIGELLSILASVVNSTNLLRTGQLENLQMHEILRKMMEHGGFPLSLINGNTDGNLYLTTKEGCEYLQHILDLLFMPRFSKSAIAQALEEEPEFKKFFDLEKWDAWRKQNKPFYTMLKNTVEVGGIFNRYRQTSVNRYAGVLTNFNKQEKDRKGFAALYEMYDKYCKVDKNDNGDDVRKKVVAFYKENFANLPADFNLKAISSIVKVKGGWQCWPIIMELEQAKKQGKEDEVITDQYNKFGRGPIIDYATISRMLFDGDIKTALSHFDNPLYFCFNAKRTAKYDGSRFESISSKNIIELEKVTRYIVARTKNPDLVGNISKYKEYKTANYDVDDMLDYYANNKAIYKAQVRIQTYAMNLNEMCKSMGVPNLCTLTSAGIVRGQGEVFVIDFDINAFKQLLPSWDEIRKGASYAKISTGKLERVPTKNKLLADLFGLINEKNFDINNVDKLANVFSSNLTYFKDTKTYQITTSKDSISKVTGSMVCDNSVDKDGYYRGNYVLNEELYDYTVAKDGQLLKDGVETGVYVDLEFYYNASLYACWNMQKYFLSAKNNINNPWILSPEEIKDLITQTDINPSLSKYKKEINEYLKDNGIVIKSNTAHYKISEKLVLDASEDDEENFKEEQEYKEEKRGFSKQEHSLDDDFDFEETEQKPNRKDNKTLNKKKVDISDVDQDVLAELKKAFR